VRLDELLWFFPLAAAIALVVGAAGQEGARAIARSSVKQFGTLILVVGGVGLAIRVLVVLLV
jgi:hypothetical protein